MADKKDLYNIKEIANNIYAEILNLPVQNVPNLRKIRLRYTKKLKYADPYFILELAREIYKNCIHSWIALELIRYHKEAIRKIEEAELLEFGRGINSWGTVDAFAGFLAGPAWQQGQIADQLVHKWAHSDNRWWRRTALVCTVVLNRKSCGGTGDIPRTLEVCKILVDDHDDMVVKALSWALRELIVHDADVVRKFLSKYDKVLASRVKREVNNKLTTGLKTPKRKNK
jgi:3-methyladenine DNA glycosylase AlkD